MHGFLRMQKGILEMKRRSHTTYLSGARMMRPPSPFPISKVSHGDSGEAFSKAAPVISPSARRPIRSRSTRVRSLFDAFDGSAVRHWLRKTLLMPHPFVSAPGLLKYSRIFDATAEKIILEKDDAKTYIRFNSFVVLSTRGICDQPHPLFKSFCLPSPP